MPRERDEVSAVIMPDGTALLVDVATGEAMDEVTRAIPAARLQGMALGLQRSITDSERALKAIEALLRREFGREAITEVKSQAGKSKLIPGRNEYIGADDWKAYVEGHEPPPALVRAMADCVQAYSVKAVQAVFESTFGKKWEEEFAALVRVTEYDYFKHAPVLPPPPRTWPLKRAEAEAIIQSEGK